MSDLARRGRETAVQKAAFFFGLVFLLVGVLGFIPGITSPYDQLGFANHDSAELLGIFGVNVLHNLVHIAIGAVLVWASRERQRARTWLLISGVAYFLVFLYGLVVDHENDGNVLALNDADNVLHLLLTLGLVASALLLSKRRDETVETRDYDGI